jgi:hypothetical protein
MASQLSASVESVAEWHVLPSQSWHSRCGTPDRVPKTTWKPHTRHGELDSADRESLPDSVYAFPKQRKAPLTDASHVRNALARFDQVEDVSDADRELAFANIERAAEHYGLEVEEQSWHDLGKRPHTRNRAHD